MGTNYNVISPGSPYRSDSTHYLSNKWIWILLFCHGLQGTIKTWSYKLSGKMINGLYHYLILFPCRHRSISLNLCLTIDLSTSNWGTGKEGNCSLTKNWGTWNVTFFRELQLHWTSSAYLHINLVQAFQSMVIPTSVTSKIAETNAHNISKNLTLASMIACV